jgi:hypothetical protein
LLLFEHVFLACGIEDIEEIGGSQRIFDGISEAKLIALTLSPAPEGFARRLVERFQWQYTPNASRASAKETFERIVSGHVSAEERRPNSGRNVNQSFVRYSDRRSTAGRTPDHSCRPAPDKERDGIR